MIAFDGNSLTLKSLYQIVFQKEAVEIAASAISKIQKSRTVIEGLLNSDKKTYSINTGFGILSDKQIPKAQLEQLQANFVRSHCAGAGELHTETEVRAMIALRANALAKAYSGVRLEVIQKLCDFLNHNIIPAIPKKGSVGCSGDLAPLAHLALVLIGEGEVLNDGKKIPAADFLKQKGIAPLKLQAKEGLSLTNGTQQMTALGALALKESQTLLETAELICATSIEGLAGTRNAFKAWLHETRSHQGQKVSSQTLWNSLQDSEIYESHKNCDRVQDPYSFRCAPQVHGAIRDLFSFVQKTLEVEINSATDNPLVNPETGEVLSNGNFHGQPIAFALDILGMGIAELGNISERRTSKLINPVFSELPAFLVKQEGLNSGFMIPQYLSASLVVENRLLSHPASTDSVPTSNDKEDHNSMGSIAAFKLKTMLENTRNILSVELLAACQALEFRKPKKPAKKIEKVYETVRAQVPALEQDRVLTPDIEKVALMIKAEKFI